MSPGAPGSPPGAPVEVVIAVHTPRRPVGRAVASVLDGNAAHTRTTVVCHNVPAAEIAAVISPRHRDRVRYLEHRDPRPSASGPFNAGMAAADGEYLAIMGSDDWLQPGAVASWLDLADRTGAETVITRLALGRPGRPVRTPPTRPWLRGLADPVKDRLSYRSAPLGLVSRAARDRLGAALVEGMTVGGDVPYVTRLWFGTRVAVDRRGPAYVIGTGAEDRVTYTPRPIREEFAFVRHLLDQDWFRAYPAGARRAVCTKLTRIHLFGAVHNRPDPAFWTAAERTALADAAERLLVAAPGFAEVLSLADRDLLDTVQDLGVPAAAMIHAAQARRRHGRPRTLVPRDLRMSLAAEAPLRLMAASALTR
ncbi:glycosyltransferase [Georgenia sp. TF02-10]|uniref:glycosyltransferase family 2 protein n=1 Tax=Georgenia sp. TF02-10 TaxID=2917725 RepID=UPI001FA71A68|nr:glycosyltransferase family A protein [Georgenia sp. TF02-10]UNX55739.1 glycosyltransferase [Georgenia sp. TF02-10]